MNDVPEADFSFDDFLDMINPLEHIPVISSVYRAITDEKINPVSRIVGDLMYGGITGVATAVMGAVGAIGDSVMEASTGKDATGVVLASLFGSDKTTDGTPATQLASAASPAVAATASVQTASAPQAAQSSKAQLAGLAGAPVNTPGMTSAGAAMASIASMSPTNSGSTFVPNSDAQTQALVAAKAVPARSKNFRFGGVMDPGLLQGSNMALSMASSAPGVQMNHMVYPGGLTRGPKPSVLASAPATPALTADTQTASSDVQASSNAGGVAPTTYNNPLPPELVKDLASLRAINQYRSTASQNAPAGANVDVMN